jgi:hypothetical protein
MAHMPQVVGNGRSSSTDNGWAARVFTFTDDWTYSGTLYASLNHSGTGLGHHTLTMSSGASAAGITGSGRLGLFGLLTGADTAGTCRVHTCAMGAFDSGGVGNLDRISHEAVLAVSALATAGDDYTFEVGLVGNAPGYGAFLRYKRSVGGVKWMAVTENAGTETVVVLDGTTQSGVTTVDAGNITALSLPSSGMFRVKTVVTGNGAGAIANAKFYLASTGTDADDEGTLCATLETNLPTHSLAGSVEIAKTAGTNSVYAALDFTELIYEFNTARVP